MTSPDIVGGFRKMKPMFECVRGDAVLSDENEPVICANHKIPLDEREMGNETVRICPMGDTSYKISFQY